MCMMRVVTFSDSQAKPTRANGSSVTALVAAGIIEIGSRLVGKQHRLSIEDCRSAASVIRACGFEGSVESSITDQVPFFVRC